MYSMDKAEIEGCLYRVEYARQNRLSIMQGADRYLGDFVDNLTDDADEFDEIFEVIYQALSRYTEENVDREWNRLYSAIGKYFQGR